jgi:hypothetical protein
MIIIYIERKIIIVIYESSYIADNIDIFINILSLFYTYTEKNKIHKHIILHALLHC